VKGIYTVVSLSFPGIERRILIVEELVEERSLILSMQK